MDMLTDISRNGQLKEYIAAGTTKQEFLRRLRRALVGDSSQAATVAEETSLASAGNEGRNASEQESQPPVQVQALLAERAARLEADKKAKEAAAKAEAKKRAEERRTTDESTEGQGSNIKAAENKYANVSAENICSSHLAGNAMQGGRHGRRPLAQKDFASFFSSTRI
jgi:hypothetical protein